MPILLIQIITVVTNVIIFIAIILYFVKIRTREKILEEKERQADSSYHHVVEDALAKERKILDDASAEASHIITSGQYINQTVKQAVDQALAQMAAEVKKDAGDSSAHFMSDYQAALKQLSLQSVTNFQTITKGFEGELQTELKQFRDSLLPNIEKEIAAYKEHRIKDAEHSITQLVQKISREVLRNSITIEDHEKLILEALERAKKEGIIG